jgi:carboxylesterase type B
MKLLYLIVTPMLPLGLAAPTVNGPSVTFSTGTIIGTNLLGVHNFKGIPFAQPPVGSLRLKPPQPLNSSPGTIQSQLLPQGCPQFFSQANTGMILDDIIADLLNSPFLQKITSAGEDCLTLNVQRPATATAGSNLPVVFWMFGGGFEFGSTQLYDGTELIATSMTAGQDVIFVATNYRTGGFGFLGGKEILADGSSNLGLLDQRMALEASLLSSKEHQHGRKIQQTDAK